jgi:hypothetical protein
MKKPAIIAQEEEGPLSFPLRNREGRGEGRYEAATLRDRRDP